MGSTAGLAITRPQLLGPAEAPIMLFTALLLLCLGSLAAIFPRTSAYVAAGCAAWLAVTLLLKATRLYHAGKQRDAAGASSGTRSNL